MKHDIHIATDWLMDTLPCVEIADLQSKFKSRDELFRYMCVVEGASRLLKNPTLALDLRRYLIEIIAMKPEIGPHHSHWLELLDRPFNEIVRDLFAPTSDGEGLRRNAPFYKIWSDEDIDRLSSKATTVWLSISGEPNDASDQEQVWLDTIAIGMGRMAVDEKYRRQIAEHLS